MKFFKKISSTILVAILMFSQNSNIVSVSAAAFDGTAYLATLQSEYELTGEIRDFTTIAVEDLRMMGYEAITLPSEGDNKYKAGISWFAVVDGSVNKYSFQVDFTVKDTDTDTIVGTKTVTFYSDQSEILKNHILSIQPFGGSLMKDTWTGNDTVTTADINSMILGNQSVMDLVNDMSRNVGIVNINYSMFDPMPNKQLRTRGTLWTTIQVHDKFGITDVGELAFYVDYFAENVYPNAEYKSNVVTYIESLNSPYTLPKGTVAANVGNEDLKAVLPPRLRDIGEVNTSITERTEAQPGVDGKVIATFVFKDELTDANYNVDPITFIIPAKDKPVITPTHKPTKPSKPAPSIKEEKKSPNTGDYN